MLNTSLHNPNVKDKPSLQRFVSMNRGINHGEDLPTELLTVSWLLFIHLLFHLSFLQVQHQYQYISLGDKHYSNQNYKHIIFCKIKLISNFFFLFFFF